MAQALHGKAALLIHMWLCLLAWSLASLWAGFRVSWKGHCVYAGLLPAVTGWLGEGVVPTGPIKALDSDKHLLIMTRLEGSTARPCSQRCSNQAPKLRTLLPAMQQSGLAACCRHEATGEGVGARMAKALDGKDYQLVITGHSLGAGTAALIGLKLKDRFPGAFRCMHLHKRCGSRHG